MSDSESFILQISKLHSASQRNRFHFAEKEEKAENQETPECWKLVPISTHQQRCMAYHLASEKKRKLTCVNWKKWFNDSVKSERFSCLVLKQSESYCSTVRCERVKVLAQQTRGKLSCLDIIAFGKAWDGWVLPDKSADHHIRQWRRNVRRDSAACLGWRGQPSGGANWSPAQSPQRYRRPDTASKPDGEEQRM